MECGRASAVSLPSSTKASTIYHLPFTIHFGAQVLWINIYVKDLSGENSHLASHFVPVIVDRCGACDHENCRFWHIHFETIPPKGVTYPSSRTGPLDSNAMTCINATFIHPSPSIHFHLDPYIDRKARIPWLICYANGHQNIVKHLSGGALACLSWANIEMKWNKINFMAEIFSLLPKSGLWIRCKANQAASCNWKL